MRAPILLLLGAAACTAGDAVAAGDFTLTVINRDNTCNFASWNPGDAAAATATITQNRSDVTASVTGLGALVLEASVGRHVFTGQIDGGTLTLTLIGTRRATMGSCTFTYNGEIDARIRGDILTGQIHYRAATDGSADCAAISTCLSTQDFTGARPHMVYNSVTDEPDVSGSSEPPTARSADR
jgi:hypothetical protein